MPRHAAYCTQVFRHTIFATTLPKGERGSDSSRGKASSPPPAFLMPIADAKVAPGPHRQNPGAPACREHGGVGFVCGEDYSEFLICFGTGYVPEREGTGKDSPVSLYGA